ncbi:hypothetical protein [Burkholderia cenocepacia]|uniref:hypothetical protein n=1 Tax=Burkholderia cenocepacia TaxID=95486 RepID=UPI000F5965AB|nr:hypothetical protein [Burkholderia cenocepacia]MDN7626356.1 hypothetical protein [Burkholderia cenocepacia]
MMALTPALIMTFKSEFEIIDLISQSQLPTRAVDAFSLSVIKMDRQIRKLFTYLVFQSRAFGQDDIGRLREVLGASRDAYFEGFERAINVLYRTPVQNMVGYQYAELKVAVKDAIAVRNKVFHGQLTQRSLKRERLEELSYDIRQWCSNLARGASEEVGYDGFERPSFRKGASERG